MQVLVLASGSARRRAYLKELGVRFEVIPAEVDESLLVAEAPDTAALRLARDKAGAVQGRMRERWVLAADTLVAVENEILGKPADRADARRMLGLLSGREHRVVTGIVLLAPGGAAELEEAAVTRVTFRRLGPADIDAYLDTGEADDKAGAYGIQGAAAPFVAGIEGSFSNVVGLPLEVLEPALRRRGFLPLHAKEVT